MKTTLVALVSLSLASVAGMPALAATPAPAERDPFLVSDDSLNARFSRVAVSHVTTFGTLRIPSPDDSTRFTPVILDLLSAGGFEFVPPETVLARWRQEVAAGGGLFDTRTGRRDEVRARAALARMASWLRDSLGAQLWLRYETVTAKADYEKGEAQWDGVTREIGAPGFMASLFVGPTAGRISVWSEEVTIEELGGATLYSRRGGLVPTMRMMKDNWIDTPYRDQLGTPWQSETALRRALSPWFERVHAAPRAGK